MDARAIGRQPRAEDVHHHVAEGDEANA
jgi:hypothetical protein